MPCGLTTFFSSTGSARNRSRKKRHSFNSIIKFVSYVSRFPPLFPFFPVFIAVLQHTFPSRTRLLRGPATMILHIRVWESSSTPDFFCTDETCFYAELRRIRRFYRRLSRKGASAVHWRNDLSIWSRVCSSGACQAAR